MPSEEAEAIEAYYAQRQSAEDKRTFIRRMEHKLNRKERLGHRY